MNGKRFSEDKARKNGFYLALAVCLVAVGIAAWSTYDAVNGYMDTGESSSAVNESEIMAAQQEQEVLSGQQDDDPEAPRDSASQPAEEAAGTVTVKPAATPTPTPLPTPTPEPDPEPVWEAPVTAPLYEISTQMIWPLESKEAAKAYSAGAPVYSETMRDWRIHTGVDIKAESGEEVKACANGIVQETYTDSMLGNVITIEHGDYVFSYCGVGEDFKVKAGDVVTKGQTIATVTAVPCEAADGAHLHLEARRDNACMDPAAIIEGKA